MNHKLCRTCLQPPNGSIFKQVGIGGKQIPLVDMLKLCTGIDVAKSDKISLDICNNCTGNIVNMYLYRQTCWNSQAYLLIELQNKLSGANPPTEQLTIKSENVDGDDDNNQSEVINPLELVEVRLNDLKHNDNKRESPATDLDGTNIKSEAIRLDETKMKFEATGLDETKITYTKKQALSKYCEFIKKSPKRGSNGAWKCRKCKNVNIVALRMLQHLHRAHDIKIKFPKLKSLRNLSGSVTKNIGEDLTGALTKQQALSTYTFYPNLNQAELSSSRTTQECRDCGYTNTVPSQMIYHLRNSHNIKILDGGEYKCTQCDVKCRSYFFLLLHEKTHDESTEQQPKTGISQRNYACSKCDHKFETQFNLDRHMKRHVRKPNTVIPRRKAWDSGKGICEHCGKTCATPTSLREHVRTHTGEKPYSCNICDYRASHYTAMTFHMRLHGNIRPYKCETCDKSYANFSGLAHHRLVHSDETPFECTICSKKYKYESTYRMHLNSHDPDTYVACEYCGRKFATLYTLNLHIKQHTGEKPHVCEFCDKRFIQRTSWRLHMKNHHQKIVK